MDAERPARSAILRAVVAASAILAFASSSHATPWKADPQAVSVSDRVVADCQDAAADKGLKGFEWKKYVTQCIKDSKG